MTRKSKELYISTLTKLCDTALKNDIDLDFRFVSTDYEIAAISAFKHVFPQIQICGCLFHLCQSIMLKISDKGLKREYQCNSQFAEHIKMIIALAFVPASQVCQYLTSLKSFISENVLEIWNYFEVINLVQ